MKKPFFNVGDIVTIKDRSEYPNGYFFGGSGLSKLKGTIKEVKDFVVEWDCYALSLELNGKVYSYTMLECEM